MIEIDFIKGKKIFIDEYALTLGGAWNPNMGVYDPKFLERCIDYITEKQYKYIFDIGANTGQFSLFPIFDETLNIYSFEPLKDVFNCLIKNVELNSIKTTKCYNLALSDMVGESYINKPVVPIESINEGKDYASGLATMGNTPLRFSNFEKEKINCITLDKFVEDYSIEKIDLLKIDTEGFEYFVVKGGLEVINKFKPDIITEINDTNSRQCGIDYNNYIQFLQSLGYNLIEKLSEEDYLFISK